MPENITPLKAATYKVKPYYEVVFATLEDEEGYWNGIIRLYLCNEIATNKYDVQQAPIKTKLPVGVERQKFVNSAFNELVNKVAESSKHYRAELDIMRAPGKPSPIITSLSVGAKLSELST